MRRGDDMQWTGVGVYSVPQAARLVHAPVTNVRRWLHGYRFRSRSGSPAESDPVFKPALQQIESAAAIGFLDLIELLFIKAFRDHGVSLPTIRRAAREASRRWSALHPFCLRRFATDGYTIFSTIQSELGDEDIIDLPKSQHVFLQVVRPYFRKLDYGKLGGVDKWWPLGKKRPVFLDPHVAFGKPVVKPIPVPTEAIYAAVQADQTEVEVAEWLGLPLSSVRAAVEFERGLPG